MNMIAATQYSCTMGDIACYCTKSNWAFGIRDCASQGCTTAEADNALNWAITQCENAGTSGSVASSAASAVPSLGNDASSRLASLSSALAANPSISASIASQESAIRASISRALSSTTLGAVSLSSSISAATTAPPNDTARPNSGLSTGAKAGIGIAVPIAVIGLAVLAFLLWRRKARTSHPANGVEAAQNEGYPNHPGLMVPAYEDHLDPTKPELDGTSERMKPELADTSSTLPVKSELDGLSKTTSAQSPVYDQHRVSHEQDSHELPTVASTNIQAAVLGTERATLEDVGPAIVIPAPFREEDNRLEQLRAQRAIVVRDRERKEEIERMRAEEERLDKAIAELENRRL